MQTGLASVIATWATLVATALLPGTANAQETSLSQPPAMPAQPAPLLASPLLADAATRLTYGPYGDQRILFYPAPAAASGPGHRPPPLAVYIHGGSWRTGGPEVVDAKPQWFPRHNWAFASIGFRSLPDAPVEAQARDIGLALAHLRREATKLGFDPDRILLLGHSSGAHLAALVSTDAAYATDSFAAIKGTILIDGAAYDVSLQMTQVGAAAQRLFEPAFGTDPARQKALSPLSHVGARNVANWLLLYSGARPDAAVQSSLLASALNHAGARAHLQMIPSTTYDQIRAHHEINATFGTPAYAGNAEVEDLMAHIAGR